MNDSGDVIIAQTPDGGDITIADGIIAMSGGLESTAYLALFGGNFEDNGRNNNPSSWWGNRGEIADRQIRSRTQNLLRSIPATSGNLLLIKQAVLLDLAFFISLKIASSLTVAVTIPALNNINIKVDIIAEGVESSFNFTENWKSTTSQQFIVNNQSGIVSEPLVLSYSEQTLADPSLVAYWRFGEASGTVAVDELGNTDGVYVGGPTLGVPGLITGDTDTAVNFLNNTQWMVASGPALAIATEYTLEAWVTFTTINPFGPTDNQQTIFVKRSNGIASTTEFVLDVAFGGVFRLLGANGAVNSTTQLVAGVKYYVVGTRINDIGSIYINGVLDISGPLPAPFASTQPVGVGVASDFGTPLASVLGVLDDPALYNAAFSAQKVSNRYAKGMNL